MLICLDKRGGGGGGRHIMTAEEARQKKRVRLIQGRRESQVTQHGQGQRGGRNSHSIETDERD